MWGFSAAARYLPSNVMEMRGIELQKVILGMTTNWHPDIRELFGLADPDAIFPINIRTSEPSPQWKDSNVTLIGGAIHAMTPAVASVPIPSCVTLDCRAANMVNFRDGEKNLLEAVLEYEEKMVDYGFGAALNSRKQLSADNPLHNSSIGRLVLAGMRTSMRSINHIPSTKNRMAAQEAACRGRDRDD